MEKTFHWQGYELPFPDVHGCLGRKLNDKEVEAIQSALWHFEDGSKGGLCGWLWAGEVEELRELREAVQAAIGGYLWVTQWLRKQAWIRAPGLNLIGDFSRDYRAAWCRHILALNGCEVPT